MTVKYCPKCGEDKIKAREAEVVAWKEKYPNHCKKCMGAGVLEYTENMAPLGSGRYWPMQQQEPCECVEDGNCPRCGEAWLQEVFFNVSEDEPQGSHSMFQCDRCGWDDANDPQEFACPPTWECYHWEDDVIMPPPPGLSQQEREDYFTSEFNRLNPGLGELERQEKISRDAIDPFDLYYEPGSVYDENKDLYEQVEEVRDDSAEDSPF